MGAAVSGRGDGGVARDAVSRTGAWLALAAPGVVLVSAEVAVPGMVLLGARVAARVTVGEGVAASRRPRASASPPEPTSRSRGPAASDASTIASKSASVSASHTATRPSSVAARSADSSQWPGARTVLSGIRVVGSPSRASAIERGAGVASRRHASLSWSATPLTYTTPERTTRPPTGSAGARTTPAPSSASAPISAARLPRSSESIFLRTRVSPSGEDSRSASRTASAASAAGR